MSANEITRDHAPVLVFNYLCRRLREKAMEGGDLTDLMAAIAVLEREYEQVRAMLERTSDDE